MSYKSISEAVSFIADIMVNERKKDITVKVKPCSIDVHEIPNLIYKSRPVLIACVKTISIKLIPQLQYYELYITVLYNSVMPSTVMIVENVNSLSDLLLWDVKLHRRCADLVFPNEIEEAVKNEIDKIKKTPVFLDCFIIGTQNSFIHLNQIGYSSIKVKFIYSCNYDDYVQRNNQANQAIDEIAKYAISNGKEDWKKAFYTIKYCVEHWNYGKSLENPKLEYTSYGALVTHTAVCMGISLAVCAVFSKLGIPCRYITGERNTGGGHAWNLIYVKGGWFYIDVTDAIGRNDPYYHWGMIDLTDRIISEKRNEIIKCNCPVAFLKINGCK